MEEACRHLKEIEEKGHSDLRVAVNISMPQFRDPEFVNFVKSAVTKHGINPQSLELEITESVVMDEPQIVVEALKELKAFGVTIAIDDFGTGFSSMSYLQQLPLDRLKVDRSFVNEVMPGKTAFIAETIVTLGNKLGLQTIAEGVEKREQASYMLKLGCDEAQGYLYAKPMPYNELVEFLGKINLTFWRWHCSSQGSPLVQTKGSSSTRCCCEEKGGVTRNASVGNLASFVPFLLRSVCHSNNIAVHIDRPTRSFQFPFRQTVFYATEEHTPFLAEDHRTYLSLDNKTPWGSTLCAFHHKKPPWKYPSSF